MTWCGSLERSKNGADQMSREEGIYARAAGMERDLGTVGSKREILAVVDACRECASSPLARRWVSAHYMRRRGW